MKKVEIKCEGAAYKPINELIDLQGDLKHLPQEKARKLKASIIKHGFIAPFFVWDNDGVLRLIDGHQRLKVLKAMREEGWEIPDLPVVYINAENEESAKEKLYGNEVLMDEFLPDVFGKETDLFGGEL